MHNNIALGFLFCIVLLIILSMLVGCCDNTDYLNIYHTRNTYGIINVENVFTCKGKLLYKSQKIDCICDNGTIFYNITNFNFKPIQK